MEDRIPTHDTAAEATVVNALLSNDRARQPIFERLTSQGDIHAGALREAYVFLRKAWDANAINNEEIQLGFYEHESWVNAISKVGSWTWPEALDRVVADSIRRKVWRAGVEAARLSHDPTLPLNDLRVRLNHIVGEAADARTTHRTVTTADTVIALDERIDRLAKQDRPAWIPWGIPTIPTVLADGTVTLIAARPRHGKTALMCSCALQQGLGGYPVGIVCIEMSDVSITARLVSQLAEGAVTWEEIMGGLRNCTPEQVVAYREASQRLGKLPINLHCGKPVDIYDVRHIALDWVKHREVGVVYVDYVQKMRHPVGKDQRERITNTSSMLKDLALELEIPLVVLAQLNRDAGHAVPRIEHLKESGALEEDADVVVLLDRPEADGVFAAQRNYARRAENGTRETINTEGKGVLLVGKNRNGPGGFVVLDFDAPAMRYRHERYVEPDWEAGDI